MQGNYDYGLVALSYLIASLAGFVAIEFASRMRARSADRRSWLMGGALAMGTGIWSMHFVGMTAFSLPVPITYDAWITLVSWIAAVGVCALALYIVGYGKLGHGTLAVGALVMGAGICLMHYGGMWAMRMSPGIVYRPAWFAASVGIAVAASGAALLIIAYLKEVRSGRDIALRVGAALTMGLAVAGMHYTGMGAAQFADGALCAPGNQLSADLLPLPATFATLVILGFGIAFTIADARELATARHAERELEVRVHSLAFTDHETGLPNRARLSQLIVERVRMRVPDGFAVVTFRVEGPEGSAPPGDVMTWLKDRIVRSLPDATIARTQPEHLVAMINGHADAVAARCGPLIELVRRDFAVQGRYRLATNRAHCPDDGESPQWLLLRAAPKSVPAGHAEPGRAGATRREQQGGPRRVESPSGTVAFEAARAPLTFCPRGVKMTSIDVSKESRSVTTRATPLRALRGVLLGIGLVFVAPAFAVTTSFWANSLGNTNSATAAGIIATVSGVLGAGSCSNASAGYGQGSLNNTANAAAWYTNPYGNPVAGLPALALVVCFGAQNSAKTVTVTFSKPVDNPVLHLDRLGGNSVSGSTRYANSSSWRLTGATASGNLITLERLSGNPQFIVRPTEFRRSVVYTNGDPVHADAQTECTSDIATQGTACGSIQVTGTGIRSLTFSVTGVAWGDTLSANDGDLLEMAWSVKGSTIMLRKQTTGGFGSFGFVADNTTTADIGTSATSSNTTLMTSSGSNPASSGLYRVGDHSRDIVLTETPAADFTLQSATCQDQSGATVPATLNGSALRIAAANYRANQDLVCTFGNAKTSRITLTKTWVAGAPGDTVNLSIAGGRNAAPGTSTPEATTAATAIGTAGGKITIEEIFATPARGDDYETSLDCPGVVVGTTTDRRAGTFKMPGTDVTCTFTNARKPNLKVTKASNADPAWAVGQAGAQYTLNVMNPGGMSTSGAVTVVDTLPAEVSANWTNPLATNGWSCTSSGRNVSCRNTTPIAAGGAAGPIVLPVNVVADGDAVNYASVGGGGDPFNGGAPPAPGAGCTDASHCASHATRIDTPASITTVKTLTGINGEAAQAGASVKAGDVLTYTITSANSGQTAGPTTLTETVPAETTYTGPDAAAWTGCSAGAAAGTSCSATQSVPAEGEVTATFTVTVVTPVSANATTLTNRVTSSADEACAACAAGNPVVKPQLSVTKRAAPNPFTVGQSASYAITVANQGEAPTAGSLTISDTLPAGITLARASGGDWSCTGTGALSCVYTGTLAAGASTMLTLEVEVGAGAANGDNTATVSGGGDAGCSSEPRCSASVQVPVNAAADIVLDKTVDNPAPNVGETVTFTITASNDGPSDATGVTVTDALPAGLSFVSATASRGAYDEASGLWTVGALANGAQATLTMTAQVLSAGALSNTATKSAGDQFDPDTSNNAATASVNAQPSADLQVNKTASTTTPNLGDNVSFTITVRNAGPNDATGVVVDDALPAGLNFVSATATVGSYDAETGVWTLGDLADDAEATLTLVATVGMPGELTNTASVAAVDQHDPNPANDSGGVTINGQAADIQVLKTVDEPNPTRGDTVTFTVTVSNLGPSAATGVRIEDVLPAGLTFLGASPSRGAYDRASGLWSLGDLAASGADAVATLTIAARVDTDARVTNAARLDGVDQTDPDPGNNQAEASVTPIASADVSVVKDGPAHATPGTNVTYAIVVSNAGPSAAAQVSLADPTPAGLTFVSATAPCATGFPCALGDLAAGASARMTVTFAVPPDYAGADPIANTATVTSATEDPDSDNNASTVTTPVERSADLQLTKTAPATVTAGGTIRYTLTVSNPGPSHADGTTVSDPLPAGLTDASVVCAGETGGAVCGAFDATVAGTITTLPPGGSATITITATAPDEATTLSNTATATPPSGVSDPDPADNQDSADTEVTASANLSVAKTGPATATAGTEVTYRIVVSNAGPSAAAAVSLADPTPAGLSFVSADAPCAGGFPCDLGDLAAGASATVNVTYAIPPGQTGTIANTASVTSPTPDPDGSDDTSTATTELSGVADLQIRKIGPATVQAGGTIRYTLVVSNAGPSDADGATYRDAVPGEITAVTASCRLASGGAACANPIVAGNTVSGTIPTLPRGGRVVITITGTVPVGAATLTNAASVTAPSDTTDPDPANNTGEVSTEVSAAADIAVTKTVDAADPSVGENVTFTVTARNTGPNDATGVQITDGLPAGLDFVGAVPSQGTYDESTGLWDVGALANGTDATLTIVATVMQSGAIVNTATVTASDPFDPDSSNNAGSAGVNAGTLADVQLDKTVDEPAPNVGSNVSYTVTVRNAGPSPATDVNVTDLLPAGLAFVSATASQGTYDEAAGLWTVGVLEAGAQATLTIVATVTQAGEITNTATAAAAEEDPNSSNNADGATISGQAADLQVVKTVDESAPPVNGRVTYTVTVTNNGPSAATHVMAVDALPAGLSFVSATPSQGTYDEATGAWTVGDLAASGAGATATLTIVATVNADQAGATIANVASSAGSDQTDPNPANDEGRVEIVPQGRADLSVVKDGPAHATPGTNVTYTLVTSNAGPSAAAQVSLADPTPAGLTFVSATAPCASGFPCALGDLAAGAGTTVTVTFAVPSDYAGADPISNTATVTSATEDPDPDDNASTVTTPVERSADLQLTKTAPATVTAGGTVTYTLVVSNLGPSDADGTTVSDPLPAGLTNATASCAGETGGAVCGAFDATVAGTIAALPPGGSATITITATAPDEATTLSNTATATPPSGVSDPDPADNQDSADTEVTASANLSVAKTGPATATAGTEVTYRIVVSNAGPSAAAAVSLADPTPAGLSFVSADAPCAGGFPCDLGDLAAGASATVNVTYAIPPGQTGTIANTASVTSPTPDPDGSDNTSTATTPIARSADVRITKTAAATVTAGGTITYTLVASNEGPSAADGATVDDPLPAGLSDATVSCSASGGAVCGAFDTSVAGTLAAFPAGASATITITATAPDDAATLSNTARIAPPGGVTDPQPDDNRSTAETAVEASANLSLRKSGPATVVSGGTITYTLRIANAGPSVANGATYSDALPSGITGVAASCGSATGGAVCAAPNVSGNTVSGSVPTLPSGGAVTITITGTAPVGAQTLTNTASVVAPGGTTDPDPADNTDQATTEVDPAADIAVSKTVDEAAPNVGEDVTFTVTATNRGPDDATGVEITDGLPLGLAFVSATASQGAYDDATGLWTVGALANGASATLQITATVTQPGAIVNTATRTGGDPFDPVNGNNAGSAGVNAGTLADLQLDKTVDEAAPNVGSNVTYTVRVSNAGPSPATAVNVTDELPEGLNFVSATPSPGTYDESTGLWTIGDLAVDAEATLTIVATVTQPDAITNSATAAAAQTDPDLSNNADGVTINGQAADIQVVKTVDEPAPPVNGQVTYTVTVINNGPSAATRVTATDALPAGLSFVGATASQGAYDEVTGVWTIGDLATSGDGASATLSIVATVNADQAGTTITNWAASAGGDQTDPVPGNNEDGVEIVPQGRADVSVVKIGPASATPGMDVTYSIVVRNAGPGSAGRVSLADPTPAGLSLVSADAPCVTGFPCDLGDLAAGDSVTVTVTYAVPSGYAGADPIVNTATATSPTDDPDPDNNTSTATTPVPRSANLQLTKTAPATVTAAGTIVYTLVIGNAGPGDADGATVSDPLPAGLTGVSVACGGETGGAVCGTFDASVAGSIATLPAGGRATVTITATAPDEVTTLRNTATVTPPAGVTDPDTGDNRDSADSEVVRASRSADLSVIKTGPAGATAGGEVAYTLRVRNDGPDVAEAVTLDDPTPAGLTFVSAGAPCADGFPCALGDLAAGGRVEVVVRFAVPATASGSIENTATVSSPTPDPDSGGNTSTVRTPVVPLAPDAADLLVNKTGPASVPAGGTLSYTITVTNRGPAAVPDAVLDDPTPNGLVFVSATSPCEGGFPCTLPALANGARASVTATYAVQAGFPGPIANTATVGSPTVEDPTPGDNADTVTTSVGAQPEPALPVPIDARWMLALLGMAVILVAGTGLGRRRG